MDIIKPKKAKRKPYTIYLSAEFENQLQAAFTKTQWTDKMSQFLRILLNLGLQEATHRENNGRSFLHDKPPPLPAGIIQFRTFTDELQSHNRSEIEWAKPKQ